MIRTNLCLAVVLFSLAACNKSGETTSAPKSTPQQPGTPKPLPEPRLQACSLITNEEVGAIQTATITEATSNHTSDGTYLISQCYYASREPNMSVSFTLTEPNPDNPAGAHPREYWKQVFGSLTQVKEEDEDKEKERKRGGEEEEERKVPPRKIEGVGEEAYWTGNRFGGALYVLKQDLILRISVGGPDTEEIKINKSKALAEKAITRL